MDIYQFAMRMELDGERYYRLLADQSNVPGLRRIFLMLAGEEGKHFQVIEQMNRGDEQPELAETKILDRVGNIFAEMKAPEKHPRVDATDATESYLRARDIEEESRTFYAKQADRAENEQQAAIFLRLAEEEDVHLRIMESIVDFVSRPEPGNWLENAEWHHLESY